MFFNLFAIKIKMLPFLYINSKKNNFKKKINCQFYQNINK